ncbi:protein unc-45 homolog B-like [Temnothorax curvispinosus]|uniref:Protein unc-45 homolog B-like n=1 Tax=Temnothorax curvispinosus TaxID=300111 RepID=A0A6J1QQ24_9HYME|nr:protein unc-45 homolog B-like [Temnothorax curvispinosus]
MAESDMTAQEWKEKGNEELKKNNWSEASSYYTNALKLEEDNVKKAALYKYRAEAYLKLGDYEKVIEDCDSTLKICCNRVLHHRCQALEALKKFEEANRDAQIIISSDNENIQFEAERLFEIVQEHCKRNSRISAKISQVLDPALNVSVDMKKRETAMSNLQLLTYEKVSADDEVIFKENNLSKITQLVNIEKDVSSQGTDNIKHID